MTLSSDPRSWKERALSKRTRQDYRRMQAAFETWCSRQGETVLPATPGLLGRYLRDRALTGDRHSTLVVRAAAIGSAHKVRGLGNPADDEAVRKLLRAVRIDQAGTDPKQASGLTSECLARIRLAERPTRSGRLTVALCSTMRDGLLRIGEAAAIEWRDVHRDDDGTGTLTIRKSKTDRFGAGAVVALSAETMADLDRLDPNGNRVFPLTPRSIARRIKTAAKRAACPGNFSGHSPRVGMAQDLYRAKFTLVEIQIAGRWKSPNMVAYYCRRMMARESAVARFHKNPDGRMTQDARPFREYVVGQTYRVPCVRGEWGGKGTYWWPVNGPVHDDARFLDFPWIHWHIDARFATSAQWRNAAQTDRASAARFYSYPLNALFVEPFGHKTPDEILPWQRDRGGDYQKRDVQRNRLAKAYLDTLPLKSWYQTRRKRCMRQYSSLPQMEQLGNKLRAGYENARLDLDRRICPHKGADLSRIPDQDGVIECPLHGLRFALTLEKRSGGPHE